MRTLATVVLAALTAAPVLAQVEVHALPNLGYDAGYGAPSVGLGLEADWAPTGSPIAVALRPSADYVFADKIPYAVPYGADTGDVLGREYSVLRLGAEALVHWRTAPLPVVPYAKVGLARETERVRRPDAAFDYTTLDGVAGLGLVWGRLYVEGTHGFGDASRNRVALGVRL